MEELVSEQLDRSRAYDLYKQLFDDLWHDVSGSIVRSLPGDWHWKRIVTC